MGDVECTCELCDVSRDPWHPEYVRGWPRDCPIHSSDALRAEFARQEESKREYRRRHEAAMKAAREAP